MTNEGNRLLPIFVNGHGLRALVVGGGPVASAKVGQLLDAGLHVTVVSPELGPALAMLAAAGEISWEARAHDPADLDGRDLVICATDDAALNGEIAAAARARRILVNVVDTPDECTFYLSAVLERGAIKIAVSTDGGSPAFARRLRAEIAEIITPEHEILLDALAELRPEVQRRLPGPHERRRAFFDAVLDSDCLTLLREEGRSSLTARLQAMLDHAAV